MYKVKPEDLKFHKPQHNGFYRGVVEDNNDPDKAGRVRIRIWGLHSSSKTKTDTDGIPTNELPWAEPCVPIMEGGISGFGLMGVPLKGSHVMVFFENGNPLKPMYFASCPAIPKNAPNANEGFNDPDGQYPSRTNEPDFHRLARGVTAETLVETKNSKRKTGVSVAGGSSWDEPTSPYGAQYPHNTTFVTHGGVTLEFDSTPNSARMHIYHPSNSYIEIDNDGNMVIKNNAEKYEVTLAGRNVYVKDNNNETTDNDKSVKVGGNEARDIGGNQEEIIGGNVTRTVGGDESDTITGDVLKVIGGDRAETITGKDEKTVTGNIDRTTLGNINDTATGIINIMATGNVNIMGAVITLLSSVGGGSSFVIGGGTGTAELSGGKLDLCIQDTVYYLLDENAMARYNAHTHAALNATTPHQMSLHNHTTSNVRAS